VQCYVIFHDFYVMKGLRKSVLTTKRGFAFLKSGLCRERGASLPLLGAGVFDNSGNLFSAFRLCCIFACSGTKAAVPFSVELYFS
jgi:hypothetical protein